jgi:hypothetical protein
MEEKEVSKLRANIFVATGTAAQNNVEAFMNQTWFELDYLRAQLVGRHKNFL